MRIFLVEDEALIRMMTAEMLEELGHHVVAEAGTLEAALSLAQSVTFDIAILDLNLNGAAAGPVADAIERRGLPFIFATGYADSALPEAFRSRPHLQKPFVIAKLQQAIDGACRSFPLA